MRHPTKTALGLALALALSAPTTWSRPIAIDDLRSIVRVQSPRIAPDGRSVVVVAATPDYEANRFVSRLVLVDVASGARRDLTSGEAEVSRPRWSPSGDRLAYLVRPHDEDAKRQVSVLPMRRAA